MTTCRTIDDTDAVILTMLQDDARVSNAAIARRLGMAASATLERIRKLEARGLIRGYEVRLDPEQLDCGLLAFVFVRAEELVGETATGEALAQVTGALEVHHIAGEDCYLVKLRARDTASLGRLLREELGAIPTVRSTRTTIVLGTILETSRLPLSLGVETAEAPAEAAS